MLDQDLYRSNFYAQLYDLDPRSHLREDLAFYQQYLDQTKAPVLIVGGGTGRLVYGLRWQGQHCSVIDSSPAMLRLLVAKSGRRKASPQCQVILGDISKCQPCRTHSLIIVPYNMVCCLVGKETLPRVLQQLRTILSPDGRLIIHAFRPKHVLNDNWLGRGTEDWMAVDSTGRRLVERSTVRLMRNIPDQFVRIAHCFKVRERGTLRTRTYSFTQRLSFYYDSDLRIAFERSGYVIEECFGSFLGHSINNGDELCYVLRRAM